MTTAYWYGDYFDLNDKRGLEAEGFDPNGVHSCCREYRNNSHRRAPVASLNLGAPTKAILKCDEGIDLAIYYPSFVQKTLAEIHDILNVESNHFFNSALDIR